LRRYTGWPAKQLLERWLGRPVELDIDDQGPIIPVTLADLSPNGDGGDQGLDLGQAGFSLIGRQVEFVVQQRPA
jgi:hypothetical protein